MPKILRPIRILLPALLATLAAGCESATLSPEMISGTFVLETYNGEPLPYETASLEHARYYLLESTIELSPDGTGTESVVTRTDFRDPAMADVTAAYVSDFGYEIDGDRLRVTYGCSTLGTAPAAASDDVHPTSCLPGPHAFARFDGEDEMVVTVFNGVLRYRREE